MTDAAPRAPRAEVETIFAVSSGLPPAAIA